MFCVYLSCYKRTAEQTRHNTETLDILVSPLDTMEASQVLILGDMNSVFPQKRDKTVRWCRSHDFNGKSCMLSNFFLNNNLTVANFSFENTVNYTSFRE